MKGANEGGAEAARRAGVDRADEGGAESIRRAGDDLFLQGMFRDASRQYKRLLELDANDEAALYRLGLCFEKGGKYQEAINWYDRGLVLNLNNKKMWLGKGICLQHLGRSAEAKRSLERALHFDPEYSTAMLWLGKLAIANRQYEEALEYLDRAINIDPSDERAWYSKGIALSMGFGRFEEALECYDKALEGNPDQLDVQMEKGVAHRALGHNREACDAFEKVLDLQPSNDTARRYLKGCRAELSREKARRSAPGARTGARDAMPGLGDNDGGEEEEDADTGGIDWDEDEGAEDGRGVDRNGGRSLEEQMGWEDEDDEEEEDEVVVEELIVEDEEEEDVEDEEEEVEDEEEDVEDEEEDVEDGEEEDVEDEEVSTLGVDWEEDEPPARKTRRIRCPRCSHINSVDGSPGRHLVICEDCGSEGVVKF